MVRPHLPREQLRAVLSTLSIASVTLHVSMPPPKSLSPLLSALAGAASSLLTLRGLQIEALRPPRLPYHPNVGLVAFTRLRTLTLHQWRPTWPKALQAKLLPPSLEELTVALIDPDDPSVRASYTKPPLLVGFGRLLSLRQITFAGYSFWPLVLRSWDHGEACGRLQLPSSLEVLAVLPAQEPPPSFLSAIAAVFCESPYHTSIVNDADIDLALPNNVVNLRSMHLMQTQLRDWQPHVDAHGIGLQALRIEGREVVLEQITTDGSRLDPKDSDQEEELDYDLEKASQWVPGCATAALEVFAEFVTCKLAYASHYDAGK